MTRPRGWTTSAVAFLSILGASLAAAFALARMSAEALEASLDRALGEHLVGEAGLLAAAVQQEPLEAIAALDGERSAAAFRERVGDLVAAGSLRDGALFPPGSTTPTARDATQPWIAAKADAALIAQAAKGDPQLGPLYRSTGGDLYRTAYVDIPGHPGWVLAVEGSGATLGAVNQLEVRQLTAGGAVFLLASLLGSVLAFALTRPLHRLERELTAARPGDPPDRIEVQGSREVRRLAESTRSLLLAIRDRDTALAQAHTRELDQLTTLAATVAHEVRNPLNALGLTIDRLGKATPDRRAALSTRATACIEEIERIVDRFLDLSRPVAPQLSPTPLLPVARSVASEFAESLAVTVAGVSGPADTDGELVGQVIRNLLRNATEAGARTVGLTIEGATIDIQDDGPGIHPDDAVRVFDWFHTTRARGTGLGLPVSRRICRALGGDLVLVTGHPTHFRIQLPGGPP